MYESSQATPSRSRQCEVCKDDSHAATHHCVNCDEWFCSVIANAHKNTRALRGHVVEEIGDSSASPGVASQSVVCWDHNRAIDGYDTLCQRAVCFLCIATEGAHKGHEFVGLEAAAEQSRTQLPRSIATGEDLLHRLSTFRQHHDAVNQGLLESFDKTNALIRASFTTVRDLFETSYLSFVVGVL